MKHFNAVIAAMLLLSAAAWSSVPDSANPYVRKSRSAAVSLELGGNSLASLLGVKGTFFVQPQVAVDVGLGLSGTGLRPGVYGRYLFSKAKFSPFAYTGLKYGLGTGGRSAEIKDPEDDATLGIKIDPSPFWDLGLGIDYLAHNGFYFTGGLGWSTLLGGKNYEWTSGAPSQKADDVVKLVYGSGPALFLSLGYAF